MVGLQSRARVHRCQPDRQSDRDHRTSTQGIGLDVQVYGALRAKHDWQLRRRRRRLQLHRGRQRVLQDHAGAHRHADASIPISPMRRWIVRQVNTTRFSLFTPETRDFFLQDVAAFEFGGRNFGAQLAGPRVEQRPAVLLAQYRPRPAASRSASSSATSLSGEYGGFNIGALTVLTDETPTSEPGQVLSVARVTHPIFARIEVRLHLHQWRSDGTDREHGRGRRFPVPQLEFLRRQDPPGRRLLHERSFSSVAGDDNSAALALNFPNEPWCGDFLFKQIGESFLPALGFVNRTAIRQYVGTVGHLTRYRNTYLNQLEFGTNFEFVTDLQRPAGIAGQRFLRARGLAHRRRDHGALHQFLRERAGRVLPAARGSGARVAAYEWNNFSARVRTFDGRPLRLDAEVVCCSFYNGTSFRARVQLALPTEPDFRVHSDL